MGKRFGQVAKILVVCLTILILLGTGLAVKTVRRSWPQTVGNLNLPGLQQPVEVRRDSWGVPHIYASNTHDLFMAQGYVHAQDRFWQMDFWRHAGAGRLSEMFGARQLETDKFLRTLGWARVAQQEVTQMEPALKADLQAYADGINAYLADHQGSALSLEYAVLRFLSPTYRPEPWQLVHTLTWGKVMAWDLGDNASREIERLSLLKTLTTTQVEELFPPYPSDQPVILPSKITSQQGSQSCSTADEDCPAGLERQQLAEMATLLDPLNHQLALVQQVFGTRESGLGSNNWVVSGQRTATGKPLLADDPHLGVQLPSIWYENGLHCLSQNAACPYDVAGVSFPGMLGVVIGQNDRIAWGVTNVGPDVQDLYIEKLNPQNPNQYEVNGKWVDMQLVPETIQIAGQAPVTQIVRYTRHGPIVSDTYKLTRELAGPASSYAISLRWTALDPSRLIAAIPQIDRARNWSEFRTALQDFDVPAQNFVYADVEGNIGYQMPGRIPIRSSGTGRYPVSGWTDAYEWKGYIPYEQLPSSFNPKQGYIASANNAVVDRTYPYLIGLDWDYGYRAARIEEMLTSLKHPLTIADMQQIQGDSYSFNAASLVPILLQIPLQENRLERARQILRNWDFQQGNQSAPGALFEVFWKHLLAATFHDQLPQQFWPKGGDRWFLVIHSLIQQPQSAWWDDRRTPQVENRDAIFQQALAASVDELERKFGSNPNHWQWGALHQMTFRNQSLGKSGLPPLEALLNRGPFSVGGDGETVNSTHWDATKTYEVTALASMRLIADLSDRTKSLIIHAPGQSGHAFHRHYSDMVKLWQNLEFHPISWNQSASDRNTEHLRLQPLKN